MVWYDAALLKMNQGEIYSHKDIVGLLSQEKPGLGRSGYHWAIDKLLQKGELERMVNIQKLVCRHLMRLLGN